MPTLKSRLRFGPSSRGGFTVERGSRIWLAGRGSKLFVWLGGSEFY